MRYIDADKLANDIYRAWELWEKKGEDCYTDDVRNLVISLTHGGYKKEAAAIVHKYAAKVTEVPESALDELYAALEQLGGNDGTDA